MSVRVLIVDERQVSPPWKPSKDKERYDIVELLDEISWELKTVRHELYWLEENRWAVGWEERVAEASRRRFFLERVRDWLENLHANGQKTVGREVLSRTLKQFAVEAYLDF